MRRPDISKHITDEEVRILIGESFELANVLETKKIFEVIMRWNMP